MKTKMSATSSGEGASSQTSAVTTSTVQSSVWSLCDISTDSHVDLRDITPSISPVFTDDQVHALTRNPNEVDVLDEHFIPHDALKRIDEALRSQGGRNLLYSITNSAPTVAPYNDNETTDLHFTEAMFSQFDTISDETDKIINKDDRSLQNITVSGRDIMQSSQSNALNWKRDGQSTETSGAQNSHESKPGNPGESNMPKGLRRSPRNLAQLKKDAESSKTTVATTRPISRGKDISKLKYANAKKEDLTKKEVRRSGRVPKKMEKDDSSEDKSASEVKTSAKKKNTREAGEEKKSSSEEQDAAAKNVRRSPRNMNKLQEEEKNTQPSRKKQEKLVEVEKDNNRQNKSLVIDKEADCEETCDTENKPAKSEIQGKTEKDSKQNNNLRAEKEQEEKQERTKSGRATRKTGSKEKKSEDEDVSKDVKTRKKKEDNLATKKTEKTCKAEKVDEEDLVKNKKESSIDINAKSTSKDDVPSDKPKKNELQNRQQGKNSSEDDGRVKARKKDQTKTKETEDGGKEEENQGSDEGGNKKEQDHPQKNSSKTTEMVAKCTSVEKKEGNTGGNRCKGSEDAKQESKVDKKEVKSAVLNETNVKSSGVEKVVDATLIERPGNDSAEQKEVTTDVKREGEKEASDMEDSSDNEEEFNEDSDYDPEYDPDRLWCVCRKPHGNRFMICCDQCEEWFHGACVGVTMSQGRQMEKKGQEYICPKCKVKLEEESKKEPVPAKPEETPPSTPEKAKKHRASKADHSPKLKMPDNKDEPRRHRHSSHRESSEGSLQHERKSKHSEKIFIKVQPKEERKRKIHEPTGFKIPKKVRTTPTPASHFRHPEKRKCITSGCSMFAHRGSLYCSQECIARHVEESVRILSDERRKRLGAKATGTSSKSVLSPTSSLLGPAPWDPNPAPVSSEPPLKQGIAVIERSTGRVIAGVAAPSQEELVYWLQDHPMFEVLRPSGTVGKDDKNEKKKEGSEKTVRENIKKSLKEILITRCKEQQDLSVSEEDFQKCANSVEQEMYSFFGDTGPRYKNKYRSLMFNLKDPRNKVLFRHVLSGEISVDRLVRMTPEQLASPELATWREQEVKHTLEMIKLNQEEINATKAHIKKTHKGEVEIDDDDLSNLENSVKIKAEQNAEKDLPDSNTSSATLLLDTTDEHRIHLFDLNCRICTGKMAPPGEPPRRETPAPLVSTTAIIQAVAESSMPSPTPVDVTSANSPDSATVSQPPLSPSALSKATKKVPAVWKGFVMMQSVAKFGTNAYQVSGPCDDLLHLLPDTLHIQGRIAHEQVWDYLVQLKSSTSREVCVIRYEASSSEEKMSYLSLYSYFYSRNRCGVVSNCYTGVKDMYLVPLASHQPVPPELMPFDGPGLDEPRPHMLLGVIVRAKALFKRPRALSQRSLSPPAKRRASSGSLETSSSEGVAVESPVKKRDVQVALHDSPPADIDDIVFQYHSSQAVKNASKEKTESPAKASTPTDFSTLPVSSSSGPVVSPVVSAPLLSLEAQKQHLLDLQERARQYILAQTQRKVTDSGATNSEVAGQQTTETTGASKGEQHMPISDDSAPYDPEEGLDLDLDDPSSKPAEVVPESGPKIPAVIASSQEPTKPSGIQMLVSTLKKLQGSAAKSLAPQLSALTSVLSSQRSSGTAANQQDQSSTSTVSSTPPLQLTTAASQETRLPVFGHPRSSVQSVSSAADVLKSAVSPGSGQPEMVSTSRHVHSPNSTGPGSGSSVSSSEAWRTSAATGCGPYARPAQSASSIILGQQTSVSSGHELQSAVPTRSVVQSTAPVRLGPPSTVFTSRELQSSRPPAPGPPLTTPVDPQSKAVPGLAAHSSDSTGRGPLSVASAGIAVPRVSTSDGSSAGIHEMQSTSVSTGSGTHLTVSSRPSFQSTATTNQGPIPSGRVLQPDAGNRWSPSEPPQIVRRVEHGTQQERDCNGLRPEERARLAAHESRRFRGHNRDERSNQGRMGDTHRPDWGEQRFPRDSRSHEPGQGWRGQYRPGRPWSGGERRRDRHERSFDHRSRPGEQRDERRFKEHWNRDRWRR